MSDLRLEEAQLIEKGNQLRLRQSPADSSGPEFWVLANPFWELVGDDDVS